jgi:release factor glutamine methyltransferase
MALDGGPDGLQFYRQMALEAGDRLKAASKIMIEIGAGQAQSIREIFSSQNWIVESVIDDYSRHPRILVACRPAS